MGTLALLDACRDIPVHHALPAAAGASARITGAGGVVASRAALLDPPPGPSDVTTQPREFHQLVATQQAFLRGVVLAFLVHLALHIITKFSHRTEKFSLKTEI